MKLYLWRNIDPDSKFPSEAMAFANNKKEAMELVIQNMGLGGDGLESMTKLLKGTTPQVVDKPYGLFLKYGALPDE